MEKFCLYSNTFLLSRKEKSSALVNRMENAYTSFLQEEDEPQPTTSHQTPFTSHASTASHNADAPSRSTGSLDCHNGRTRDGSGLGRDGQAGGAQSPVIPVDPDKSRLLVSFSIFFHSVPTMSVHSFLNSMNSIRKNMYLFKAESVTYLKTHLHCCKLVSFRVL